MQFFDGNIGSGLILESVDSQNSNVNSVKSTTLEAKDPVSTSNLKIFNEKPKKSGRNIETKPFFINIKQFNSENAMHSSKKKKLYYIKEIIKEYY